MKVQDTGNNESLVRGIAKNHDGTFTALTYAEAKTFKTEGGAVRWMARRGYDQDGESV